MFTRLALYILLAATLLACAAPPRVDVEERSVLTNRQEVEEFGGELIRFAQAGDSLHGIAFAYSLKVKRLAAWNGLGETEKLQLGQRIRLTEPIGFRMPVPPVVKESAVAIKPEKESGGSDKPADAVTPSIPPKLAPASSTVTGTRWLWPLRGTLSQRFQPTKGKQGINIQSQLGEAIKAARAGQVVYSGSSLKGYGHLIIVKHDEFYLSAYAHTQNVKVKEGAQVQTGQLLAVVGRDNSGTPALHFQIRKDGEPIDPLSKLPKI